MMRWPFRSPAVPGNATGRVDHPGQPLAEECCRLGLVPEFPELPTLAKLRLGRIDIAITLVPLISIVPQDRGPAFV